VPGVGSGRCKLLLSAAAGLLFLAGCGPKSGIFDGGALSAAKRVAVMPAAGAPGADGVDAGRMEAGLLLTSLANLNRFQVEGPGRLRKAATSQPGQKLPWSAALQADLARELGIDLLVVAEVTDYRFTKEWKSASWYFGSSTWTETTYWVALNVRFVKPDDGKLVYCGSGAGSSKEGYGPATAVATEAAMEELREFLARQKR